MRRFLGLFLGGLLLAVLPGCADSSSSTRAVQPTTSGGGSAASTASVVSPTSTTTSAVTTTSAATTTTSTVTTTRPRGPQAISVAMAGDLLIHMPIVDQARRNAGSAGRRFDFGPMLAPMHPVISPADLALCHLEVPMAKDQNRLSGYPSFGAPDELLDSVKGVGYDGCSTASNHSLDQGLSGIERTLAQMDARELRHSGTARTAQEAEATTFYDAGGAKVAHLSYSYGFNGYPIPASAPFAVNQIDVGRIHADATRARQRGAQLVIVSLHWGDEYRHEPSAYQKQVAGQLLPFVDIDVVVGHHAHVVQPVEQVEGTYVVWGLGNQLANQRQIPRSDGLTVSIRAAQQPNGRYEVDAIEAIPTYVEAGSMRVLPVVDTLMNPSISGALRSELVRSYDRTAAVLATRSTPGLTLRPRP